MWFKSKGVARGTAAHMVLCRITPKILVAAQKSGAESRTYVDSGCAISIINTLSLLVNVRQIKPIVIQGVAGGEWTIDKAGDLHLPAVCNDGVTLHDRGEWTTLRRRLSCQPAVSRPTAG
eukprot:1542608-Rhodomonas_salina.2